jgi:predicted nucleic acid-binding protein
VYNLNKIGRPIPTNDIWIAATALETGSHLITYDKHFNYIDELIIESL